MRDAHAVPLALAAVLAGALALALAACGVPLDTPAPGRDEVLVEVAKACPNEGYELVDVTEESSLPQRVVYTFESTERDLAFTAVSEIVDPDPDPKFPTGPYPSVSCDYDDVVRGLHYDDAVDVLTEAVLEDLGEGPLFSASGPCVYVRNYDQIVSAVEMLAAADEVYEDELAFNDADWIRAHASTGVHVRWYDGRLSAEDGWPEDWRNLGAVALFGDLDVEGAAEELARSYAQLIADDVAPDDPCLPEGLRDAAHRSGIERLVVLGSEVPVGLDDVDGLEDAENPFQHDLVAHGMGDVARWDEDRGTYVMRVDVGDPRYSTSDEGPVAAHSWLVEQVALLAGGSYEQDGSSFSWRCRGTGGTVALRTDRSGTTDALLTLDGETMRLRQDSLAGGAARYALVDVDAFARLFCLDATVDEKDGVVVLS
ncbi:MAG TPA: hypothetical protein IAA15_01130 [Candidatus Olsenella pullicola]|nr:hypothetical protein [Candidatus Olsenella pullicola]